MNNAPLESTGPASASKRKAGDALERISASKVVALHDKSPKEDRKRESGAPKASKEDARPQKKKAKTSGKASSPSTAKIAAAAKATSTQDEIAAKLSALSKKVGSSLSDYEKCSIFPQKLMQLLKNDEAPDAIWWLEDGESFAIEQEQFTKVMNKVSRTSKKQVKLDSILRNLYRWGFKKLKDRELPANVLAYSHPKFKRDTVVEMQTFAKKPEGGAPRSASAEGGSESAAAPMSALARALSARAQAGYGDNWNEEGAADKSTMAQQFHRQQQQQPQQQLQLPLQNQYAASMMGGSSTGRYPSFAGGMGGQEEERRRMLQSMMLQQQQHHQQQQRQMMLQQELYLHNQQQQQQRHQQALLLEAAAAERAAQYAAQRYGGAPPPPSGFPNYPPYPF